MKLRTILLILGLLAFFSATTGGYLYYSSLSKYALKETEIQAASHSEKIKNLVSSFLTNNLKAVRALAGLKELGQALVNPKKIALSKANFILDHFHDSLEASVVYLMDQKGQTIASSNRDDPNSFVGKNYSFRPYFQQAMHGSPAVYMALGVTSIKRGVYYSHPVYGNSTSRPIGVVVVKASVEAIEKEFFSPMIHTPGMITFITGPRGVVFMSDHKELLFQVLWKIADKDLIEIAKSKQFGKGPWEWAGFKRKSKDRVVDKAGSEYLLFQNEIESLPSWNVVHLSNLEVISKTISTPIVRTIGYTIVALCVFIGLSVLILYNMAKSDIIRRIDAEEALRESEEKYRNLFNNAQVGLYRTRISDGKFVEANDALARMFGYEDRADILDAEYVTADNYVDPGTRENLLAILSEHGEFRNFEARLYRKDRSVAWFRYSGRIYPEKEYIEGVAADITEEKRLEEKLLQAQKMKAIGTLAGGVAHDLNNILSGIVTYPELILLDLPEDSPLRKPILTIQESGQKAAVIVQDLLTLARRGVAITEVVNLNDIICDHLESPEHEKLKSFHPGIDFEINLDPDLLNTLGSPVHLSKTITNLLSNAAEATPHAGTITVSTSNQYLDRPVRSYEDVQEGDYVVLSVVDSGVGMSEENLARIFEPFYTKKVMGRSGTGLGMAVVWGTIKDHNGYIDIESTSGKGTRFDLYFPVTRREPAEKRVAVSIEKFMGSEKILVVDDIKEQREIASQILTKLGYSVTTVSSGEEAVEYMKENSADLLILDMIMDPGIDGLDTYKKIIQIHPGQKAIIASGFSETDRVREAQRLGAGKYIKKPYALEKIGIAVRDALKK
ncbi:MAG: response regulator [Desulfobacterales bacterium]|uniref:histidine kinase n=1 Tax=Candidatus Desulfatibia vada TaxID=2841696 RepID=A0A8J6TLR5_9BACT|nr:response regulator [Candidatus Desulfatibia vada]